MPPSTPNSRGCTTTAPSASPPACGCNAGWTWKRPGSATSITDTEPSQCSRRWLGPQPGEAIVRPNWRRLACSFFIRNHDGITGQKNESGKIKAKAYGRLVMEPLGNNEDGWQ